MTSNRAWILLPSCRRLDLLNPDPGLWTDDDLAIAALPGPFLTPVEALRELLLDAVEALMDGWDPITPLKRISGPAVRPLVQRLEATVDRRYRLPRWSVEAHALHKQADWLAAPSDAVHVAGWTREAIRRDLGVTLDPLERDRLLPPEGMCPWEPRPLRSRAACFSFAWPSCETRLERSASGRSHNRNAV